MGTQLQLSAGTAPKTSASIAPAQASASPPTETTSLALLGLNTVLLIQDLRTFTLSSVDYTLLYIKGN